MAQPGDPWLAKTRREQMHKTLKALSHQAFPAYWASVTPTLSVHSMYFLPMDETGIITLVKCHANVKIETYSIYLNVDAWCEWALRPNHI